MDGPLCDKILNEFLEMLHHSFEDVSLGELLKMIIQIFLSRSISKYDLEILLSENVSPSNLLITFPFSECLCILHAGECFSDANNI